MNCYATEATSIQPLWRNCWTAQYPDLNASTRMPGYSVYPVGKNSGGCRAPMNMLSRQGQSFCLHAHRDLTTKLIGRCMHVKNGVRGSGWRRVLGGLVYRTN